MNDKAVFARYVQGIDSGLLLDAHKKACVERLWPALAAARMSPVALFSISPSYIALEPEGVEELVAKMAGSISAETKAGLDALVASWKNQKKSVAMFKAASRYHKEALASIGMHTAEFGGRSSSGEFRPIGDVRGLGAGDLVVAHYWSRETRSMLETRKIDHVWTALATSPMRNHAVRITDSFRDLFEKSGTTLTCFARQSAESYRTDIAEWAAKLGRWAEGVDAKIAEFAEFDERVKEEARRRSAEVSAVVSDTMFPRVRSDMGLPGPEVHAPSGLVIDAVD